MPFDRLRWLLAAALAMAGVALGVWVLAGRDSGQKTVEIRYQPADIRVYVAGAVQRPGVYPLQDGDRVLDAVNAAGGFADGADQLAVNLAQRVHDEDKVVVPRQGETPPTVVTQASGSSSQLIDINTATAEQLDGLPGIGPAYSQRIIDSRVSDGPFVSPDDLLTRKLVPRSTFEKIRPLIRAGP